MSDHNKQMRIIHIMPQIGIGGAETQLCHLISNSDPETIRHRVLYYSDSRDEKGYVLYDKNNINYSRVPRSKKWPLKFLKNLAGEIKTFCPDIVHCWLWSGNLWGRWAAMLAGVEHIIVAYRNCEIAYPFIVRNLERFTKHRVHYLANSRACADFTAEKLNVKPDRFHVIYNGINASRFELPDRRQQVFEGFRIKPQTRIVTMVGRLTYQKNHPMLLKVAQECSNGNLPVVFMIVGHGEQEENLKKTASDMNLDSIVHFLGLRRDVPQILASSDVFCYTSFWEGFPNVLMEAMAAGLPIVSTGFAGAEELIDDGVNGKIVDINDVSAAFKELKKFIENPKLAEQFGKNARQKVTQQLEMSRMVQNTCNFYRNILNS